MSPGSSSASLSTSAVSVRATELARSWNGPVVEGRRGAVWRVLLRLRVRRRPSLRSICGTFWRVLFLLMVLSRPSFRSDCAPAERVLDRVASSSRRMLRSSAAVWVFRRPASRSPQVPALRSVSSGLLLSLGGVTASSLPSWRYSSSCHGLRRLSRVCCGWRLDPHIMLVL